jgi:hypothetical protein
MHSLIKVSFLGIDVAIEVNNAHFFIAQMTAHAPQRGKPDRVIAPQNNRKRARFKNVRDPLRNLVKRFLVIRRNGKNIPKLYGV